MNTKADIVETIMNRREVLRVAAELGEADPDLTAGMIELLDLITPEITKLRAERDAAARDMRERCAKVADDKAQEFRSPEYATNQPFSSMQERFACGEVAKAIRALPDTPAVIATDGKDAT